MIINHAILSEVNEVQTGQIEKFSWHERELTIYLPPSYQRKKSKQYPAVIVQDGGYLFLESVQEIEKNIHDQITEEIIFVGITPLDRDQEYTPWKMEDSAGNCYGGGKADAYMTMLVQELLPFLRRNYRISHQKTDIGMAGASFGALVSLYALFKESEYFSKFCLLSPSLWYENIIHFVEQQPNLEHETKVFMYVGKKEGKDRDNALRLMVPNNKIAYKLLQTKLAHQASDITMMTEENGEHLHSFFITYFPKAVRFLFPK